MWFSFLRILGGLSFISNGAGPWETAQAWRDKSKRRRWGMVTLPRLKERLTGGHGWERLPIFLYWYVCTLVRTTEHCGDPSPVHAEWAVMQSLFSGGVQFETWTTSISVSRYFPSPHSWRDDGWSHPDAWLASTNKAKLARPLA